MAKDDETRLTRFREWLNEGVALIGECGSPGRTAELATRHRVPIAALAAMRVGDFLDGLALALDPAVRAKPESRPQGGPAYRWPGGDGGTRSVHVVCSEDEARQQREAADRQAREAQISGMARASRQREEKLE